MRSTETCTMRSAITRANVRTYLGPWRALQAMPGPARAFICMLHMLKQRSILAHALQLPVPPILRLSACRDAVRELAGAQALEGYYLTGSKPASSPTKPLPPSPNPQSSQPVVLFRDTNAWCPYCQKVWMALLEKDIPFDSVLINLQNKPEWYGQVLESKLTPAVRINGNIIGESMDIMLVRCKHRLSALQHCSGCVVSSRW